MYICETLPIRVFCGFRGSLFEKLKQHLIIARKKAITFEKAVASFGRKLSVSNENGTVIAPPEMPEIDPIPDNNAIDRIPKISQSVFNTFPNKSNILFKPISTLEDINFCSADKKIFSTLRLMRYFGSLQFSHLTDYHCIDPGNLSSHQYY